MVERAYRRTNKWQEKRTDGGMRVGGRVLGRDRQREREKTDIA
jgi:hypothetical protein